MTTDVLIIGSGIAGMSTALYLTDRNPQISILILDKSQNQDCSTRLAQGGLAAVWAKNDAALLHEKDTKEAGGGINDQSVIREFVRESPQSIHDLIRWGVRFDQNADSDLDLGLEGGHSRHRIIHSGDQTGQVIHKALLERIAKQPQISILQSSPAVDLIIREEKCIGAQVWNSIQKTLFSIQSSVVILATGGSGQVFPRTTNPEIATGDGLAMAIRAGVQLEGLTYFQFHPTALVSKNSTRAFLLTEALRGAGAEIINSAGQRFLFQYDTRGELATRDRVSGAIWQELKKSGEPHVFLDARGIPKQKLKGKFPQVIALCLQCGFDLMNDLIPIAPAAHYQCGGIRVNGHGETSLPGLFAVGEVASTGLHGANRLASNSLPEALVFAKKIAQQVQKTNLYTESIIQDQFCLTKEPIDIAEDHLIQEFKNALQALYLDGKTPDENLSKALKTKKAFFELAVKNSCLSNQLLDERNLIYVMDAMIQSKNQFQNHAFHYQTHRV